MAIVVSDTSPIRALAFLGLMDLLRDLYSDLLIPPAVERELRVPASDLIAVDVSEYPFIKVQAPADPDQVEQFFRYLDRGESEALALALEVRAGLFLIDESKGRAVAVRKGLVPIGVLGTLLRAKERGLLVGLGPLIDKLQDELRFFISPGLKKDVLRLAGEESD